MGSEIKKCPFCGGEARFEIDTDGSFMLEVEHGPWCFLTSMDTRNWYYCETVEEAAEDWNTRAERTCHNINKYCNFKCSECGSDFYEDSPDDYPAIENGQFNYCPNCGAKVVD